ncbi:uncharacterized protein [Diadema setosum]|uniref:uncharacterized protein n=1 Tax=Diadema setosum TaxID=31175 RepID=UPI003B3A9880
MMVLQDAEPQLIPEEKEEDEHTGAQNSTNERLDATSLLPSRDMRGEGLSDVAMASEVIDFSKIKEALNQGSDQDYNDLVSEAAFLKPIPYLNLVTFVLSLWGFKNLVWNGLILLVGHRGV